MRKTNPFLVEMGTKIKTAREKKGWSQCKLASLAGLERTGLSRIENGRFSSKIVTLKSIADALECDVKEFL